MQYCKERWRRGRAALGSGRVAGAFVVISYIALSALPFMTALHGKGIRGIADTLLLVATQVLLWCGVWAALKRPALFHWLLLPAFVLVPVDVYLYLFYGRGLSARHIAIVWESGASEASEFLGAGLMGMLLATLACAVWWWLVRAATLRTRALDWTGPSRRWALGVFCVLVALWAYGGEPVAWVRAPLQTISLSDTRPFGVFAAAAEFRAEQLHLAELRVASSGFVFGASLAYPNPKPLVIVLVIGESSRYDRWGLNGYARNTTPLLSAEANLVSAVDVTTPVSSTLLSLPVMLSRKGTLNTFKTGFGEKSFLFAYKEAGFKTYWFSNQIPFGKFDTPVSVFANEADVVRFLNLGSYSEASSLDEVLLPLLQQTIHDDSPKKLIVLHTLGNHWNYSLRHPAAFERWQPSLTGIPGPDQQDAKLKTQINNSYDNSVLYTDWFLSEVIRALKTSGQTAALLYASDHGENLQDGNCGFALHGHNTEFDFHVPLLAWYSDGYGQTFPDKVAQLRQHAQAKLSTENIFHSLLDMGDLQYPTQQLEWSIFNAALQPHRRLVDSYGWADYDQSTSAGVCREVIDKGTPRPRSAGTMQ